MKYFICAKANYVDERTKDYPIPIMDEDTDLPALFDTRQEAEQTADNNMLCEAWGYEIIEWDV